MTTTPATPHAALDLLTTAHPPALAGQIFKDQVKHRPLLLRPSDPSTTAPGPSTNSPLDARSARRLARRRQQRDAHRAFKASHKSGRASLSSRPRPLSAARRRRSGLYEVPVSERKWALYEGLHRLWCGYVREVLGLGDGGGGVGGGKGQLRRLDVEMVGPLLGSADFHGAVVRVVRCGCVSRVGLRGIVVKDTKFTLEMVTRGDELKVVPKERTIFAVEVPLQGDALEESDDAGSEGKRYVFELYGDRFKASAGDRTNKKFREHLDTRL